ncbi:MAG: DUF2726 domain-containing protein [Candidatus Absconditabacteria bacterium]|nr:DUF2726 domain-containing protein [Candidatus Absconditabacteria bacterium]
MARYYRNDFDNLLGRILILIALGVVGLLYKYKEDISFFFKKYLVFIILGGTILLGLIIWRFIVRRRNEKNILKEEMDYINSKVMLIEYELKYQMKKYFFSLHELDFFNSLKNILNTQYPGKYDIFPKTRLADIFEPDKYSSHKQAELNKIRSRHVDFLIVDQTNNYNPVLGIEVNGESHNSEKMIERDIFVESLFNSCELPFLVITNDQVYNENYIIERIKEKLE